MPETKSKVIAGHEFKITQPYTAGHTLTEIEAKVLNQVRSENIGNNVRKAVVELLEAQDTAGAEALVAERDAEYEFSTPSAGGRKLDPVEREARKVARDAIRAKLSDDGRKLSDIDKEKLEEAIDNAIEKNSWIMDEAKKRVNARKKFAEKAVDGLSLDA